MTDYTGKNSDYRFLKGVYNFIIPLTTLFYIQRTNITETPPFIIQLNKILLKEKHH